MQVSGQPKNDSSLQMERTDMTDPLQKDVAYARTSLGMFLVFVLIGSAPLLYSVISSGLPVESPVLLPQMIMLMWVPALVSIGVRLVRREGFRDISFRLGGWTGARCVGLAVSFPALVGLVAYGIAWGTGLVEFAPPAGGWFSEIGSPFLRFAAVVVVSLVVGTIVGVVTAAGEEIGWRGYMLPRMVDARVPYPLVASGIVWALWHVPGIVSGQYAAGPYPWLSVALFLTFGVGISVFWGALRLRTGSIWGPVLGHSSWNAVIEGPFTSFSHGRQTGLWVGESGIIIALVVGLTTIVLMRMGLRDRRRA